MQNKKITRRDLVRERWLRGRLDYKLHAGQKKIRAAYRGAKNQLFVGECSRQFGKTFLEVVESLETAFKKPKAKIKIGTAFHTDLIEFILPAFDTVLQDCPEDIRPVYKTQQSKWVFHNGSEIKLIGLDRKPNGMRGTVIDLIILDEAGFMSRLDYLYKSVIIPATTHRPDCRILVFSTPPDTPAHEFLDLVQKAELEGGHCKFTIYDNPMVDAATIARLMKESGGANSTTWRREYLCEHITDANLAIIGEWKDEWIQDLPRTEYFQFYHRYAAMDLGVSDHTAVIWAYWDFLRAKLIVEDEYIINGPDMTTELLQRDIKQKESSLWWNGSDIWQTEKKMRMRVSDNNNPLLLQDLSHLHGLHFIATDKGRLDEMVNTVRMLVSTGSVIVHPRCKHVIGCLKYGVWDKNRKQFARSKVFGHFDAAAALVYLVRNLDRSTNPIPHNYNVDNQHQLLFSPKIENNSTEFEFKTAFGLKR